MSSHSYAVLVGAACVACAIAPAHAQTASPTGVLTLQDAFARALSDAPSLLAFGAAQRAAGAAVRQADRGLNPTVDVRVENALGSGLYSGLRRSESTLSFSQTLERGGDRAARTALASRQGERVKASADVSRQDLLMDVEAAYVEAQRAVAERLVADERVAIAREVAVTVQRRVDAARDPLLAASRSMTQQAEAEIAAEAATPALAEAPIEPAPASPAAPAAPAVEAIAPAPTAPPQAAAPSTPATPAVAKDESVFTFAPDEGFEIKLVMEKGAKAQFEWFTDGPGVNYDTHADGEGIKYHGYGKGTNTPRQSGELVAAFKGGHGWFWRNRTDEDVTITLRISGAYSELKQYD